jgi:hypothetical protein
MPESREDAGVGVPMQSCGAIPPVSGGGARPEDVADDTRPAD